MPYPDGCEQAVRLDERRQEIVNLTEEATLPFRRCIEDIFEQATMFREKIDLYCRDDPTNRQLRGAQQVASLHVRDINKLVDRYGIREELDID